jgi:hypothetical protein
MLTGSQGEDTESADHVGVVAKFLHTSRAFSVLHVIDWFRQIQLRETYLRPARLLPSSLFSILRGSDTHFGRSCLRDSRADCRCCDNWETQTRPPEPKLDPPSKRARFTGTSQSSPTHKPQSISTEASLTKPHSDGARARGGKKESK